MIRPVTVTATLILQVPVEALERHLAASPRVVGEDLGRQVWEAARRLKLGYYPALDYFEGTGEIEPELLDAARNIAWFASELTRNEIRFRLRPVFSSVRFLSIQNLAFTIPSVRPRQPDTLHALIRHYTPDRLRITLQLSSIERDADPEAVAKLAKRKLQRWLKESFTELDVVHAE